MRETWQEHMRLCLKYALFMREQWREDTSPDMRKNARYNMRRCAIEWRAARERFLREGGAA
jgi:hypothetical protein